MQSDSPKLLLSIDEAASALGLSRGALYNLTRSRARVRSTNPLPFVRLGKRIGFRLESLRAWIETTEQNSLERKQ